VRDEAGVETLESKRRTGFRSGPIRQPTPQEAAQFANGGTPGVEECYEPGRQPTDLRIINAAKLIPAGTDIWVNVHYTPNGTPITDHVQIGFTLAKEEG
jgi:hypothetical protein